MLRFISLIVVGALMTASAVAETIYVNGSTGSDAWDGLCEVWDGGTCGPKATIQAAIDAASAAGDEVLVAPGTYGEAINFLGKAVNLRSASGRDVTIIDATGLETSVVTCSSGEGPGTILAGFTITGGTGTPVGPTWVRGGGMYSAGSSPTVTNCRFLANTADYGGGLANDGGSPTVTDCTFDANWVWNQGGAMYSEYGSPTVTRCTFSTNGATHGGGIACHYGEPSVTDCTFNGNTADGGGGAVANTDSDTTFANCVFSGNYGGHVGALYAYGGGMLIEGGLPVLINCTFSGNSVFGQYRYGGGIWVPYGYATLTGCILWGNAPDEVYGVSAGVTFSDVRGGYPGALNLDEDPVFVRNPGPGLDGRWGTDDDDFGDLRLTSESPCIDAASFVFQPGETDLAGNKRFWDGDGDGLARVDMGAFEFGSFRYGDLNCDSLLNTFDIDPFVLALTDPAGYEAAYPGCDYMLADINGDGLVNAFDIDRFVLLLTGG